MDNRLPAAGLSGLDQIRAIFAGETRYEGRGTFLRTALRTARVRKGPCASR
jgi:hypothetical protein